MSPIAAKTLRLLLGGLYVAGIAVCFVVCGYVSFKLFVRSGATPAPDLVGLGETEAAALLADQGLELRRLPGDGRFDDEIPAGGVLHQDPPPHTLVKRGSTVEIVLSLGPERIEVPDLSGKALPAAQVTLAAAGLAPGRTLRIYSGRDAGTVVEQAPAAGAVVPPMASVDLLLSQGDGAGTYLMPDLVYRDYDEVRAFFTRRGFRFGSVKFELYEGARSGVVLRQFPLAGHPLTRRDAISLVVAASAEGQIEGVG